MKKMISLLVYGALFTSTLSADISRLELGTGAWLQNSSGSASYNATAGGTDTPDSKLNTNSYVWLLIKHPIPVLPNIRLEYSSIEATGNPTGTWEGKSFSTGAKSTLDITQYDVIPYYNLLDNTAWTTIDLGVDAKIIQSRYTATQASVGTYEGKDSIVVPMGYLRARVEIPNSDVGIEADIKYVSYGSSSLSDFRAKVDYTFSSMPLIKPAVELGYRQEMIKVDNSSVSVKTDLTFSGAYAGVMLRF